MVDLSACSYVDSSGCHTIGEELAKRLAKRAIQLVLVGANARVLRQLERSGAMDHVGRDWVGANMHRHKACMYECFDAAQKDYSDLLQEYSKHCDLPHASYTQINPAE